MNIKYHQYTIQNISPKENSVCILTKEKAAIRHTYENNILVLDYK